MSCHLPPPTRTSAISATLRSPRYGMPWHSCLRARAPAIHGRVGHPHMAESRYPLPPIRTVWPTHAAKHLTRRHFRHKMTIT
jgi:hypothetical protein